MIALLGVNYGITLLFITTLIVFASTTSVPDTFTPWKPDPSFGIQLQRGDQILCSHGGKFKYIMHFLSGKHKGYELEQNIQKQGPLLGGSGIQVTPIAVLRAGGAVFPVNEVGRANIGQHYACDHHPRINGEELKIHANDVCCIWYFWISIEDLQAAPNVYEAAIPDGRQLKIKAYFPHVHHSDPNSPYLQQAIRLTNFLTRLYPQAGFDHNAGQLRWNEKDKIDFFVRKGVFDSPEEAKQAFDQKGYPADRKSLTEKQIAEFRAADYSKFFARIISGASEKQCTCCAAS